MLNVLEIFLAEALRLALPENIALAIGPILAPAAGKVPLVNIAAIALYPLRSSGDEEETKRDAAFFTQRLTMTGDGQNLDFAVPVDAKGEIIEVELAPGHLARPGDDYWLEQRRLRFYHPPAGAFTILLRDARATGYQEQSPCRATLEINVWADQITAADNLLTPSLAAALAAFSGLDRMELARIEVAGFSLRLIKPLAELDALERAAVPGTSLFCSKAKLRLRGEWELTLALGVPPAEGIIQTLAGRLSTGGEHPAEEFKVEGNGVNSKK